LRIPLLKPNPPKIFEFSKYLGLSYDASTFSNGGPCAQLLEERLKIYIGLPETPILMTNATSALTVALQALGLGGGAEILVPSFTFSATGHSIINARCTPVLVDIGRDLVIDLVDAERKITNATKALIVVQPLGFTCGDYKKYETFANAYGLRLIFDSAAVLGATYGDGTRAGGAGDCEVFSLHITKTFGIGEGGLLTSRNPDVLKTARRIANFGFDERGYSVLVGSNAKCSDFHAAVGLATLEVIDEKLSIKKRIASHYDALFSDRIETVSKNRPSGQQVYPILLQTQEIRDKMAWRLKEHGIGSRIYYVPLHRQPYFFDKTGLFPVTDDITDRILCIPFFETISASDRVEVTQLILDGATG